jgi:hypothetical protein
MNNRLKLMFAPGALALCFSVGVTAQIYKQVDEEGNVTYTDQVPLDGSSPMVLPELSVITMDSQPEASGAEGDKGARTAADEDATRAPTRRELRRMYQDFRITRPAQEESLWGTDNMVVVSWGSSTPLQDNMSVNLYVDGQQRSTSGSEMLALKLDRGEHQVYAELLDARARTIVTTPTVTFFIKQYSALFNQSNSRSDNGP